VEIAGEFFKQSFCYYSFQAFAKTAAGKLSGGKVIAYTFAAQAFFLTAGI
jgi:hypothetical protein